MLFIFGLGHSDMKDVAYFYNFKFYEKTVEKGSLENLGKLGDRPLQTLDFSAYRGVCLVLYCSPLDKAAIFGVERLPRIGV